MSNSGFTCEICADGVSYHNAAGLLRHKQLSHRDGHILQQCEFCPESFYDFEQYTRHHRSQHPNETPSRIRQLEEEQRRRVIGNSQRRQRGQQRRNRPPPSRNISQHLAEDEFRTGFGGICQYKR